MIRIIIPKITDVEYVDEYLKSNCSKFVAIESNGDEYWVLLNEALNIEELQMFNQVIQTQASRVAIRELIERCIKFGNLIVIEFAADNVLLGITQASKTKLIADACQQAFYYLSTGSLYEARSAMLEIEITEEMAPYLTEQRRIEFINKIETFLGLELSE
jgi:hypothetical protein